MQGDPSVPENNLNGAVPSEQQEIDLYSISAHLQQLLETSGRPLPPNWTYPEFAQLVIGEETLGDTAHLTDILSDLAEYGFLSFYWEQASQLLTLISGEENHS